MDRMEDHAIQLAEMTARIARRTAQEVAEDQVMEEADEAQRIDNLAREAVLEAISIMAAGVSDTETVSYPPSPRPRSPSSPLSRHDVDYHPNSPPHFMPVPESPERQTHPTSPSYIPESPQYDDSDSDDSRPASPILVPFEAPPRRSRRVAVPMVRHPMYPANHGMS